MVDGKKMKVVKGDDGQYYYTNALGKMIKVDDEQLKSLTKEKAEKFIINADGTKT